MWSSIENLKQNLNKIALDEEEEEEEVAIYGRVNGYDSPVSSSSIDRRNSHRFAHSNGIDSSVNFEIEQYKSEIRRLQESEAELKALSVNYAALVQEREDQISRLNQENGSLKQNLDATREAPNVSRNENSKASATSPNVQKRNHMQNGIYPKQDVIGSGVGQSINSHRKEKELADLLEEKNLSLVAMQATYDQQLKHLRMELEKEQDQLRSLRLKLQEEHELNNSFQEKLSMLKMDKQKNSTEMSKMQSELNGKISEVKQLQAELSRLGNEDADNSVKGLKRVIAMLEKENIGLKMTKNELEVALQSSSSSSHDASILDQDGSSPGISSRMQEMELSLQKLEQDLKQACQERDKALQELKRLKQHLLEKMQGSLVRPSLEEGNGGEAPTVHEDDETTMESEEAEKMDEDCKIIGELRQSNEYQKVQISHLEKALKQAIASKEEVSMIDQKEIQKSKEAIEDLNKQLANCMSTIDAKNVELLNLQTALGQYFAEIEAKERLEQQLALEREESLKLSKLLRDAEQGSEKSRKENEEILSKLSHTQRMLAEGKSRVNKLEEDNTKLRRALEQSMTRLNRMSVDSDYLVDRRIVIKLLVTYFQRNHSKEVLDLMVRMLGFSDEDKQRIGIAQQGGKGVVRGVIGLPGRLVGGILGRSSVDANANAASENQSFADLWVDFLLKETEEMEKREATDETYRQMEDPRGRNPHASGISSQLPNFTTSPASNTPGLSRQYLSPNLNSSSPPGSGDLQPFEHSDPEFLTVPLTSLDSASRFSRLHQKH